MNNLAIGQAFAGISQGLEKGISSTYQIEQQGFNQRRQIQLDAQRNKQQQIANQMNQQEYERRMMLLQKQLDDVSNKQDREDTFNSFRGYMADGNVEHINRTLQQSERLRKKFPGIVRLDKFNADNPQDIQLAQELGIDLSNKDAKYRFLKTVKSDGTTGYTDMTGMYAATGFLAQLDDENTMRELKKAQAAMYQVKADGSGGNVPYDIKTAEFEADLKVKIDSGNATDMEIAKYNALQAKRGGTGLAISNIASTPSALVAPPGVNVDALEGRAKVETKKHIQTLELTPSGKNLSANMKKMYSEGLGSSVGLTNTLADLAKNKNVSTNMATKFLTEAKSKLPEELRDITEADLNDTKFRQAFMTVSSVYLKLQSGLTVSDAEREDFMQSLGSLSSNIKVNISGLRNKFSTILDNFASNRTLDPELYDYKYSADEAKMRQTIKSLDEFIKPTGKETNSSTLDKKKIDLGNKIFFGGN